MPRRFGDKSRSTGSQVELPELLTEPVLSRFRDLLSMGTLVSFSLSRDGGAMAMTVTSDGEWEREWFRTEADLIIWLDEVVGLLEEENRTASNGARRTLPGATRRSRKGRGGAGGG